MTRCVTSPLGSRASAHRVKSCSASEKQPRRSPDRAWLSQSIPVSPLRDGVPVGEWPEWATERVQVQPPHEGWQRRAARQCQQLDAALAPWLVAPVEHVGSTAVPDLAAKPIIDVQAAVVDLGCAEAVARVLAPAGWHLVPADLDGRPWRRFLVQVVDEHRVAHLHLLPAGSPRWTEQLAFRDALRADPALVHRYAQLKRTLAAEHANDREAYTAGKADFVRSVLQRSSPDQG